MKRLRRYLVAGLLLWLPLGVTLLVLKVLIDLMDRSLLLLPAKFRPDTLLGFHIPGLGVILSLFILIVTGVLVANFFGRRLVNGWESLLSRIPLIRTVYHGAKQVTETVLSDRSEAFKSVLLVQYPRKGIWSLAFQSSSDLDEIQAKTTADVIAVFVPTTPNPTSGFLILVPKSDAIFLDMDVEDGIKMILSLGVVAPRWKGLPKTSDGEISEPELARTAGGS